MIQIAALLGVVAVCVCVCVLLLQVRHALTDAGAKLEAITAKVALDLDELHRLTLEAGLATMDTRKAEEQEIKALPAITADVRQSLQSVAGLAQSASSATQGIGESQQRIAASAVELLQTTSATVLDVRPVIDQARGSLEQLQGVETDLDRQINDPAIASSLEHINGSTAAIEASAQDVQQEVHALTHPSWPHRLWHVVLDVAHAANPL